MDKVKSTGRLRYIEPTNLNNEFDLAYGEDISFPYEEYCMSVDLTVRIVNRYSCGYPDETGLFRELNYSSTNGSISFLGGTKLDEKSEEGFLTTNYTDISMITPGENTSECLGIESISITYDSWMHPTVVIKFIDVRGATVMQPSEAGYYNKSDLGMSRELYKSLFTFPYPMFVLKVKGFYGKGATYKLAVNKTDIELDSESGNFIITVSLIGYMYGVYTDIPMTYIAAAPYIPGGDEYWENKVKDGTFRFKDISGQPAQEMIKIPDLRLKVAMASANEERVSAASKGEQVLSSREEQINALNNLGDTYPIKDNWLGKKDHFELKYYYLIVNTEDDIKKLKESFSNYYDALVSYDNAYTTSYAETFKDFKQFKEKENYRFFNIKYRVENNVVVKDDFSYDDKSKIGLVVTPYEDTIDKYISDNRKDYKEFYLCFVERGGDDKYKKFLDKIKSDVESIQNTNKEVEERYKAQEMSIIEKVLGFRPSIRNIYELIFAHMDTFMHCFYEQQTKIIRNQIETNYVKRTKEGVGVSDEYTDTERNMPDIGGNKNLSRFLPPYTAFYKDVPTSTNGVGGTTTSNRKEMVWPEEVCKNGTGSDLEEVKFIKALLNGAELYYKKNQETDKLIENLKQVNTNGDTSTVYGEGVPTSFISGFIPLTAFDYINKDKINNPYIEIKNLPESSLESVEGAIISLFALRAFTYASTSDSINRQKCKAFGALEALNFYKAIGDTTGNGILNFILKYCKNNSVNSNDFINFITTNVSSKITDTWNFGLPNTDKSLFKIIGPNLYYSLHKVEDDKQMYPIGCYNLNRIKNDYVDDSKLYEDTSYISTKIPDIDDNTNLNSFYMFEVRDYVESIMVNVENEVNSSIEYLKSNKDGYKNRDSSQYGNLINKDSVLKSYKSDVINLLNNNLYDGKTILDNKGKFVSSNDLINVVAENGHSEQQNYFIKYPSKYDEKTSLSLFGLEDNEFKIYYSQNNKLAKAYLFLQSVPIKGFGKTGNIVDKNKNGVYPKALLLREGSYYWYKDNMDKVNFGDVYKKPNSNQTLNGDLFENKYETMNLLLSKSVKNYGKWEYPENCTPSRIKYLKEYFENWANTEFSKNEIYLSDELYYEDKDINKGLNIKLITETKGGDLKQGAEALQEFLRDLFFKTNTVFDLYNGADRKYKNLTAMRSEIVDSFNEFISELKAIYKDTLEESKKATSDENYINNRKSDEVVKNPFKNNDLYLTTYITLKSLYDKWLCSPPYGPNETWKLDKPNEFPKSRSEFNNFIYTDSFYHDIGNVFPVNITKVSEWLSSCLPTSNIETGEGVMDYTGQTVYNFLTDVAQDSGAMLLSIPQKFGAYNIDTVKNMFTPYNLYSDWTTDDSSFVFMYTYKPSEHLGDDETGLADMNGYRRDGDGINFTDEELMGILTNDDGYSMPAFGVTYAKQNQSIFKNIRLNTSDAGVTEAGLASTFNIASKASESPRETALYGQDLYRVFSQYSYKCSVECMGNAQIMPLMFFQLNNVPLWKGGYQIIRVNHEISAGKFDTKFEGIRINRNSIPLSSSVAITIKDTGNNEYKGGNDNTLYGKNKYSGMSIDDGYEDIVANKNIVLNNVEDFDINNVSEKKPIICITPAHGPETHKKLEWKWSSKLVDRICEILKTYKYSDGTFYNVQRCNKKGANSGKSGYSMRETQNLIKKYGSHNIISVAPHWNGGGGRYYLICLNYDGSIRNDSRKLAECFKSAVNSMDTSKINSEYLNCLNKDIRINPLDRKNTDGAPRVNCACILTENWFADCKKDGSSGSSLWNDGKTSGLLFEWLNSDNGIETIAKIHVDGIKKYIDSL